MARTRLHYWSKKLGHSWSRLWGHLGWGNYRPVYLHTYRGFGRRDYLFLSGRVLLDNGILKNEKDSAWRNFNNTIKRFNSRVISNAHVRGKFAGEEFELVTDAEGYFTLDTYLATPLPPPPAKPPFWQKAQVNLTAISGQQLNISQEAEILIPGSATTFGIISDIDDTILKTYVTSWLKWRPIYLTIIKNAFSRQAFSKVAPFYQALRRGAAGHCYNPFFYVSNSPWNLYDFLEEFLDLNKLSRGPLLLRDFGLPYKDNSAGYLGHKHEQIIRILELYPKLPFVLIGDSGERDADIYQAICQRYPGRIKAIYIRDVHSSNRAQRVQRILSSLTDIPSLLVKNYGTAAEHAADHGLLSYANFQALQQ